MNNLFERIKTVVQNFVAEFDKAKQAYDVEVKNIKANYIGAKFAEEMGKVKEAFRTLTAPMEQDALNEIDAIYSELNGKIQRIVTQTCPSDVIESLGLLKTASNVSDAELRAYFGEFGKYYLAKKILHDVATDKHGVGSLKLSEAGDNFISVDEMMADLDGVKVEAVWLIKNYINSGNNYRAANFLSFAQLNRVEGVFSEFATGYEVA